MSILTTKLIMEAYESMSRPETYAKEKTPSEIDDNTDILGSDDSNDMDNSSEDNETEDGHADDIKIYIPSWSVTYIEYNDASGISEEEKKIVDDYLDNIEDEGYRLVVDGDGEEEFVSYPEFGDAGDCVSAYLVKQKLDESLESDEYVDAGGDEDDFDVPIQEPSNEELKAEFDEIVGDREPCIETAEGEVYIGFDTKKGTFVYGFSVGGRFAQYEFKDYDRDCSVLTNLQNLCDEIYEKFGYPKE